MGVEAKGKGSIMAPAPASNKITEFYREGDKWLCNSTLPSDITLVVGSLNFHLHKFPLISKCGKLAKMIQEPEPLVTLQDFPGGPDMFLIIVKFCYGKRVELTPRNLVLLYCAADYLNMTSEYGEDNLLPVAESFLHKNVLKNWKDCILVLHSCEQVIPLADKLNIINKCLDALSVMVCTDPSLFGWPMMMYGSLQSPGGSILWNGINTGAKIQSLESDWWFEDVSYLGIVLFTRLINSMEVKGIRPGIIARVIMHYCKKYLPGLGRWQNGQTARTRTVVGFSMTAPSIDQKILLESVVNLLPEKKGKTFCKFLLGLLRVGLILGVDDTCQKSLEKRIGMQLDVATLDGLLIPSFSDSDMLYNTDIFERLIYHFVSCEQDLSSISISSEAISSSPSIKQRRVAKLVDTYMAEIASDVNLKPAKLCALAQALPGSSRSLHDGLYRAVDIYLQAHRWLSEKEKEQVCSVIDFQKLSIDACAHASQNERLPLRMVLQVLFFEQMQLKTALAGHFHGLDASHADVAGQIIQRDGWMTVVRENHTMKANMERMRARVGELEQEFGNIKQEMKKVKKPSSNSSGVINSPRLIARRLGCNLLPKSSDSLSDIVESTGPSPRASIDQQPVPSRHSIHRKA